MTVESSIRRVLVIDDDPETCRVIRSSLQGLGLNVELAQTGREGLELFEAGEYDLVVCDLFLPEVMGYDICARIKASQRPLPIISMSGVCTSRADVDELGIPVYGDDFLAKPFDVDELEKKVVALIGTPQVSGDVRSPFGRQSADPLLEEPRRRKWSTALAREIVERFAHHQSGLLTLRRGELTIEISVVSGFPVDVVVPFRRENLGLFLVYQGRLTEAQYDEALQVMIGKRQPLEQVLSDLGWIHSEEWPALSRAHKQDAIVSAFGWSDGELEFSESPAQSWTSLQFNPPTLVLEGIARAYPAPVLAREFAERGDTVVRQGPNFDHLTLFAPLLYRAGLHDLLEAEGNLRELLGQPGEEGVEAQRVLKALEVIGVFEFALPAESARHPRAKSIIEDPESIGLRRELASALSSDHYQVLGLAPTADPAHVREAFVDALDRLRPGPPARSAAAADLALQILLRAAAAYGVLSDPQLRADYDRVRDSDKTEPMGKFPRDG